MDETRVAEREPPTQSPTHPEGTSSGRLSAGALELGANLALAVLDLSETGVCLRLKDPLRQGQEVSISLEGPATLRPVKRIGTVVWSIPSPDGGDCRVGVNFQKRLEYRDLLDLT